MSEFETIKNKAKNLLEISIKSESSNSLYDTLIKELDSSNQENINQNIKKIHISIKLFINEKLAEDFANEFNGALKNK